MANNAKQVELDSMWEIYDLLINFTEYEDALLKYLKGNDLKGAFDIMSSRDRIQAYKIIFDHTPDALKYDLFINAYCSAEYGFDAFTGKIINKIQQLKPKDLIELLKSKADTDGNLTLYRGESSKSSNVKRALSWTLDRDKAIWFAKRFNFSGEGYVYNAKTNISHVIAYINDRSEEEILVKYKDVRVISKDIIKISDGILA